MKKASPKAFLFAIRAKDEGSILGRYIDHSTMQKYYVNDASRVWNFSRNRRDSRNLMMPYLKNTVATVVSDMTWTWLTPMKTTLFNTLMKKWSHTRGNQNQSSKSSIEWQPKPTNRDVPAEKRAGWGRQKANNNVSDLWLIRSFSVNKSHFAQKHKHESRSFLNCKAVWNFNLNYRLQWRGLAATSLYRPAKD